MALSTTPPPPDNPPTTTAASASASASTATSAVSTTRHLLSYPRPPNPHTLTPTTNLQPHPFYSSPSRQLPSNPNPSYAQLVPRPTQSDLLPRPQDPSQLLYPIASSSRGFLPRPVTMPAARPTSRPPLVFSAADLGHGSSGYFRPTHLQHALLGSGPSSAATGGVVTDAVKGIPVSTTNHLKVGPSTTISENNGYKDLRDRTRDDTITVIGDRKVRISENASIYTLCRSWLRNGFPEETQPQYQDVMKCLPRPLPVAAQHSDSPGRKEGDEEEEEKDVESVEDISTKDLLQRHVKRAKRVRSRLREERLQRIARYKTRLALLLPPIVEQHMKNESAAN
ncbi:formin-like protein 6 [Olea europaea var. sylvestris]|uniref:Proline-rich receptor kinase PERK8 isoform X1 n=1 Tax=Olea europaea subsp. europaea TaxID=158383 RepID=A0A8S0PLF5_OLEEU|nr:formin-like protein 6 [Olea europaea var. sylvestris]CAA2955019.1 proline-rich receptor kinase PERK8 isoform X1 [Olea europaea subsp. europaea]